MSMSTLGAQLAALNSASQGGGGTSGSALPSSRRHEDAVGRGMYHSVQVGHSVVDNKSHIFKASILYQDARQASNVPLTTLEENCVAALEELETVDSVFGEYSAKLCHKAVERGLQTRAGNEEIDVIIQELLFRLALRMTTSNRSGEDGVDTMMCGLNVVEYLIRQYDLHLRPKLVSTMLLVWLPHHENAYFLRWLQLVDLANLQTYSWLRPYAIPNAKVGRDVIAKAASKNVALCRDLLLLATKSAGLPEAGATLSFTAAVLVEAMTLQQRATGTVDERTCHALLPTIRRACLSAHKTNALFSNWGYILASTLVETSCLADEPRKGLISSILQGLTMSSSNKSGGAAKKSRQSEDGEDDEIIQEKDAEHDPKVDDDVIQSGIIVVMSLLQQQPPLSVEYDQDVDAGAKIRSQITVGGSTDKKIIYGYPNASCINDKAIWQALLSLDSLSSRFSRLLVEDGFVDMVHFITSLWLVGWKRSEKSRRLKSNSNKVRHAKQHELVEQFLKDLLQESNLSRHLWSKAVWIEALVCFVLTNSTIIDTESTDTDNKDDSDPFLDEILHILRRKNATAYDRGIAKALLQLQRKPRTKLAAYLGLLSDSNDITKTTAGNPSEGGLAIALPPRVALEHADVEIRLEAIDRVVAQEQQEEELGDAMDIDGEGDTIITVLMRRVLVDDSVAVAIKAAKTLCSLLDAKKPKKETKHMKELASVSFATEALEALYKWTEMPQVDHKMKSILLCELLHLVAMGAAKLKDEDNNDPNGLMVKLVEAIGGYLVHGETAIAKEAAKGIVLALAGKKGNRTSDNEAREVLMSHDNNLLRQFAREDTDASHMEQVLRRRFLPSLLKAYSETLSQRSSKHEDERSTAALGYCLWSMNTHGSSLSADDRKLLLDVLSRTVVEAASTPKQLLSIVSDLLKAEESLFEEVSRPFIVTLCQATKDRAGKNVPTIAIIMEVASRPSSDGEMVERLLSIATSMAKEEPESVYLGLIPTLALLTNHEAVVRKEAVAFLSVIKISLANHRNSDWKPLSEICTYMQDNESSALLGSPSLLSGCLQSTISNSRQSTGLQESILKLALCSLTPFVSSEELDPAKLSNVGHLDVEDALGGHFACLAVLKAAQAAGEAAFPLLARWSKVGKTVLDFVQGSDWESTPSASLLSVFDHATLMLKGMRATESSEQGTQASCVIIMSGPGSSGGRRRSYSFGKNEPSNFLASYPNEMVGTVVSLLKSKKDNSTIRHVRNTLSQQILASESWANNMFSKLSPVHRGQIVSALLDAANNDLADHAEAAFFALPVPCHELSKLLEKQSTQGSSLSFITYIADYGGANAKELVADPHVAEIFGALLEKFTMLSLKKSEEEDGVEYARTSLLDGLVELLGALPSEAGEKLGLNKKKRFNEWINTLVGVVGADDTSSYRPLDSPRSKKLSLSMLTSLCSLYPAAVTQKLILAVSSMVMSASSEKEAGTAVECLRSVVPVYLEYCSAANLSALDLIVAFIGASNKDIDADTRVVLYQGFADAVSHGGQPKNDSFLGPFLSSCLASDIFYSGQDKNRRLSSQLSSQILSQVAVAKRVQAVLILVSYARDIVMRLGGEEVPESNDLVPLDALSGMAEKGPDRQKMKPNLSTAPSKETLRKLCVALMAGTCEIFSSPAFARFLRHCKSDSSTPVVRLWQDLLLIQSILNSQLGTAEGNALDFWTSIAEVTNETLESIQNHLPSHIFLAFATSLVKESDSEDLRSRALQLVADRSLLLDSSDPESCLFLDMLPYLSTLFYTGNDTAGVFLVQQSALIAVEHITRKFCFDSGGPGVKYLDMVSQALTKAAEVINTQCRGIDLTTVNAKGLGNQTTKLLCTATLCAATTIRACGARALPALPNLLRTSLQLFGQVNTLLSKPIDDEGDENQSRILQLSILRLLAATVETIPQFVGPYLPDMFQPTVLPSAALQEGCDEQSVSIKTAAVGLCQAIAKKVPARQLFTPLTDALLKPDSVGGLTTLLDIMTMSISNSKATELGGKVNAILKAGTSVYDFAAEHQHGGELVAASTKMFMALVLKLSELQLRSLYSKLRAWRGDFDKDSPKNSAFKRYCFWSLSASLATQLRSIFLPCFATVFSDAVDELDAAVSNVCSRNGIKVAGGRKKQRLAGDLSFEYDHDSLVSLQAVLKCLEVSLRSDAHEGGSWIRDGESERFELLLGPLGKLFHSQVDNHISYQDLVQGPGQKEDDSGCVTECIVALASAAGDEQKWKPLNHAVLQACSHETRGEVRKAGVRCLLSLIKSIGEEYMVLIPECLPVLSELLEDSDEEIAGFAQECITSSEELLGESLEDSLL